MEKREKHDFFEKKRQNYLNVTKKLYLCSVKQKRMTNNINIGLWCNGNTTDSGPVFLGSNPSNPTLKQSLSNGCFFCFYTLQFQAGINKVRILPLHIILLVISDLPYTCVTQ